MSYNPYNDRKVKESEVVVPPKGKYQVVGINDWFTVDKERSLPIFVPDKNGNMVARAHLKLSAEDNKRLADQGIQITQGPAFSGTRGQWMMVAMAFGVKVEGLPDGDTTSFLVELQKRVNESGKSRLTEVKGDDGWAKYVEGAQPPANIIYTWKFDGARSPDNKTEPVQFQEVQRTGNSGGSYTARVANFWFKLAGDMYGDPTPYDGYSVMMQFTDTFGEVGPKAAARWDKFVELYCPHMDIWKWETDPEKSEYGMDERDNPLYVFVEEAKKAGKLALSPFVVGQNGYARMEILNFVPFTPRKGQNEDLSQTSELYLLVEAIDAACKQDTGHAAFQETAKDAGSINLEWADQDWARKNLAGLWDAAGLPLFDGKRVISRLEAPQCEKLTEVVSEKYGLGKKLNEALTSAGSF